MLDWFLYVLIAVITWALTAIVDKIILTKHLDPFLYFLLYGPAKVIVLIWIMLSIPLQLNYFFWLSFAIGIIGTLGFYTYGFAVKGEDISRIIGLTSVYPLLVAVLAAIFIRETFPIQSYLGIVLTVLGVTLISYKRGKLKRFVPLIVIFLAVVTNVLYAVDQTVSKIVLNSINYWQFLGGYLIGTLLATLSPFLIPKFRDNIREIKKLGKTKFLIIEASSAFWLIGLIMFFYAASLGPITLVSTIGVTSPLLVLLFTILMSTFWPKILSEDLNAKTVGLKALAIALLVLGIYLIS